MESPKESDRPGSLALEKRLFERVKACVKLTIGVCSSLGSVGAERPALTRDVSRGGVACTTQHRLRVGERVQISIETRGCPEALGLPETLCGFARVLRVDRKTNHTGVVALRFEDDLPNTMEFGFFMAWLLGREATPEYS
jgi:hypothetical protein